MDKEILLQQCERVLISNWNELGYTSPNIKRYPFQWLWDSCFHSIAWHMLDDNEKAVSEMEMLLGTINSSGFIPHMNYVAAPEEAVTLWKKSGTSTITQPPIYGHTIAKLVRNGVDVPDKIISQAAQGLQFFVKYRLDELTGLVRVVHPWETGEDNSPKWDGYYTAPYLSEEWQSQKRGFLDTIIRDADGNPISNSVFNVASSGFTSFVSFNMFELASATGAIDTADAEQLRDAVESRWCPESETWLDRGIGRAIPDVPDLTSMLSLLVDRNRDRAEKVYKKMFDPERFGGEYGPAGVDKTNSNYDGYGYWRGAAWPQLSYLVWVEMRNRGELEKAELIARQLCEGSMKSGFSEYWHPDTGQPLGASPQSWATICSAVV